MIENVLRWAACIGLGLLLGGAAFAAPRPLTDTQLDAVYAAGFNVQVDMGIDLAASNPESVVLAGTSSALQQFFAGGMRLASTAGGGQNTGAFDPTGAYMPNLQQLTVNNINISDNALQNASSLLNIFALQGDIAVGLNLNVVVNPTNSLFNVSQTNINWATLGLSSVLPTLAQP
jgi:hypothetical protein